MFGKGLSIREAYPYINLDFRDQRDIYGEGFDILGELEVLAVVTAYLEGSVTNSRLQTICNNYPNDITKVLYSLVQNKFLKVEGYGRGRYSSKRRGFRKINRALKDKVKFTTETVSVSQKRNDLINWLEL